MLCSMTRAPDPALKPALLERVLDHLLDKPLSALTFRSLAVALNVSTFTLIYHFGARANLVREIIAAIATRQRGFESLVVDLDHLTLDSYFDGLRSTFELSLQPRNLALQRLEFEAQMLEALETHTSLTRAVHEGLQDRFRDALLALGLGADDARIESWLLVDTFYGIQVGLVVNQDELRARASFERAMDQHRLRIVELGAMPVGS
jgi:AcrR family transcriptional regulator